MSENRTHKSKYLGGYYMNYLHIMKGSKDAWKNIIMPLLLRGHNLLIKSIRSLKKKLQGHLKNKEKKKVERSEDA